LIGGWVLHRLYSIAIHSKKAPIILVGTHKEDPRLSEDHLKQLSEKLKEKFSRAFRNIRATVFVDTASGQVRAFAATHLRGALLPHKPKQRPGPR
jgi:hypothetical protein